MIIFVIKYTVQHTSDRESRAQLKITLPMKRKRRYKSDYIDETNDS